MPDPTEHTDTALQVHTSHGARSGDRPGRDGDLYAISVPLGIVVLVVGLVGMRRRRKEP